MADLLVLVPVDHAQIVDAVDVVALDAAFNLQLVEPHMHIALRVEVRRVERLDQVVRLGRRTALVVDDGPELDEQQPRIAADAPHAGRAREGGVEGANSCHAPILRLSHLLSRTELR